MISVSTHPLPRLLAPLLFLSCLGADLPAAEEPQVEMFLPDMVSTPGTIEHGAVVTADGQELWLTRAVGVWGEPVESEAILVAHRRVGGFTPPEPAPFSGQHDSDPFPSPDGSWVYFVSERPAPSKQGEGPDLWRVERTPDGWGTPQHLPRVSSPGYEASPVLTADGDLWFSSTREGGLGSGDVWRARADGRGGFQPPENLGQPINSDHGEWNLWVSPDARWLVFEASGRPENITVSGDLYLSRRGESGFEQPVNLRAINSAGSDLLPRPGPDGLLLFASSRDVAARQTDIYAVDFERLLEAYGSATATR